MSNSHAIEFKIGGSLDIDSVVYIERQADYEAIKYLQKMDYLKIIEPRQQGKTSLIIHLMKILKDYRFCYIDMTTLNFENEGKWYESLCDRILRKLSFISKEACPEYPKSGSQWYQFLSTIADQGRKCDKKFVIALDEIGLAKLDWTEYFFSNIRAIYNERSFETAFKHVAFIFAGAFNPQDLISDKKISPFNIASRISLLDFTSEQIGQLVNHLSISEEQAETITAQIHYWTDGQPYLTQFICDYLSKLKNPLVSAKDVDNAVTALIGKDTNHLPGIMRFLEENSELRNYIAKICQGDKIRFSSSSRRHRELEINGVIKADNAGFCKIRNRICVKALKSSFDINCNLEKEENMSTHFTNGYALIVGVANYSHPKIRNLSKTVLKDAEDMRDLLISKDYCGYLEKNIHLILDDEATIDNIRKELQRLAASAGEDSTALLFFSGHGGQIEKGEDAGNYLIPYNCDLADISTTAISGQEFTELLNNIKAERLLVLFDCCHSGGVGELKKFITDQIQLKSGLNEQYYEQLSQGKGRVIIASSRSDELSRILSGMDNSLFTHYLLEALRGNGYHRGDGRIRVFDVFDYVSENVPEVAQKRPIKVDVDEYDNSQHPVLKTHLETNFPVSLFQGGQKTTIESALSFPAPETPPSVKKRTTVMKEEVMNILYEAYREEGQNKWTSSGQILEDLNLTQDQLQDFILELKTDDFLEAKFMGKKALLRISPDGVAIMK